MFRSWLRRWLFQDDEGEHGFDVFSFVEGSPVRRETLKEVQGRWRDRGIID